MIQFLLGFFKGPIGRAFDLAEKNIDAKTDRDAIKGEIIKASYAARGDYMRAGGFVLMLLFAVPLAYWFSAVTIYSVHWCADCANPKTWTIAALPAPLDEWAGVIVVSIFGVIGLDRFRR